MPLGCRPRLAAAPSARGWSAWVGSAGKSLPAGRPRSEARAARREKLRAQDAGGMVPIDPS